MFHFDGLNYQLIFAQYNHKECELARLNKTTARALVNKLNEITRVNNRSIASTHLLRDKIKGVGDYAALYDGLQEEIELYEIKYAHTGRIICYFKDEYRHNSNQETDSDITSNYCCIIAILEQHKKTRKR